MATIKNDQTLLYCHFNKIKGPGTSFHSPALSSKLVANVHINASFLDDCIKIHKLQPDDSNIQS